MVYPDDCIASEEGTREIIDNSDSSFPFILLVRHGSSDHVQPNFPTPGQIRSMFNTAKISERPEYANSPSTMSDPVEWRSTNHMEMLEERLMRIHQWNDSTPFLNRTYEGRGENVNDYNLPTQSSLDNSTGSDSFTPNAQQELFSCQTSQRLQLFENDYEGRSEKSDVSEQILEEPDNDYNHREYDVEEYVEQINHFADTSENSSAVVINDESSLSYGPRDSNNMTKEIPDLDSDLVERQKQLIKLFNLDVKDMDNAFVRDLKNILLEKLKSYFMLKEKKNECSLAEDIRKVTDILNREITDKDSTICDKVHELCLQLRDILVLKEEILSNALTENLKRGLVGERGNKPESNINSPLNNETLNVSLRKVGDHNETKAITDQYEKEDSGEEKITMVHSFDKSSESKVSTANSMQSETCDCLSKSSRIPVPKNNKLGKSLVSSRHSTCPHRINQKPGGVNTKIPTPTTGLKREVNQTETSSSERRDNLNRVDSNMNKRMKSKQTKDIIQQKEDLIRKAAVLGLIDGINDIAKIPYLTERAQLALLEKQIQGKLKSKQLINERKRIGLRDRISNLKLTNCENTDSDTKTSIQSSYNSPNFCPSNEQIERKPCMKNEETDLEGRTSISAQSSEHKKPPLAMSREKTVFVKKMIDKDTNTVNSSNGYLTVDNDFSKHDYLNTVQSLVSNPYIADMEYSNHRNFANEAQQNDTNQNTESIFMKNEIPVLKKLTVMAPKENKKSKSVENGCTTSEEFSPSRSLSSPVSILELASYCLAIVVISFTVIFYIYNPQLFLISIDKPLTMCKIVWENYSQFPLREAVNSKINIIRKFVKKKCELL